MKKILYTLIFILLTIITQIGGVLFLISLWITKKRKLNTMVVFIPLYLMATFAIIPHLAPIFGRVPVTHSSKIEPTNYLTILLNRNKAKPTAPQNRAVSGQCPIQNQISRCLISVYRQVPSTSSS